MELSILLHYIVLTYTMMIILRVFSSWVPELSQFKFMNYVVLCTEPYLGFFRRIIPSLGPMDISPILAIVTLQFAEGILIRYFL